MVALACAIAALANPYGFGLYRHVVHLLFSSGVTSLIAEYQPAPFGTPEAKVLEWVLLAFIALPIVSARRIERYQCAHVLVWLHLALTLIRNAPFFALAAAPAWQHCWKACRWHCGHRGNKMTARRSGRPEQRSACCW